MFLLRRNDNGEDGMYANYPNLIFTRIYTNRNITSRPVPYFMSTKRKEKQERDQIYSTSKRKRKQH